MHVTRFGKSIGCPPVTCIKAAAERDSRPAPLAKPARFQVPINPLRHRQHIRQEPALPISGLDRYPAASESVARRVWKWRAGCRSGWQGGHSPSSTPPANTLCSLQWFQALPAARPADGSTSQSTRAPCNHFRQGACRCHRASIGTAKRRRIGLDATNVVACLQNSQCNFVLLVAVGDFERRCRRRPAVGAPWNELRALPSTSLRSRWVWSHKSLLEHVNP